MTNYKKKASTAMSRFIRLRDAIEYCKKHGIDMSQFNRPEDLPCKCCTCGVVRSWVDMDGGHFISRGHGGGSGVYYDERNEHCQCRKCNRFDGGSPYRYRDFMLEKYGQAVIDELRLKDKIPLNSRDLPMQAMAIFYKEKYDELIKENGL